MMFDVVVIGSIALSTAFSFAWVLSRDFRAWIEQPKHVFNERLRQYDRERGLR